MSQIGYSQHYFVDMEIYNCREVTQSLDYSQNVHGHIREATYKIISTCMTESYNIHQTCSPTILQISFLLEIVQNTCSTSCSWMKNFDHLGVNLITSHGNSCLLLSIYNKFRFLQWETLYCLNSQWPLFSEFFWLKLIQLRNSRASARVCFLIRDILRCLLLLQ
ncbi:Hypothetical_protein [Hexamita inflata]|uniref:Hypothetical_protein n=1 Tax=Hexamita inflata TaxID=28002 RepID=A0ABP1GJ59_9EUKA